MAARDIVFIAVMLFTVSLGFFTTHFVINAVVSNMTSMSIVNSSNDTVEVLNATPALTNRLDYVVFGFFIAFVLALIISSWFIGGHPIFMFIYFLVIVITVVVSAVMANAWEQFSTMSIFGASYATTYFPIANHLMSSLPFYMAVIGFIGLVIMFAKPAIAGEEKGY